MAAPLLVSGVAFRALCAARSGELVVEPGGTMHEHYVVSLVDMVRASWSVRKMRCFHPESWRSASLDAHRMFSPNLR